MPVNGFTLGAAYMVFAVLVLIVCIYGFRFMLWVNKIAVWAASVLFVAGLFAFAGLFDVSYAGTVQQGSAGFWAAFVGAVLVALSNPVSFASTLGDWARYIPQRTPKHRVMGAVFAAQIATFVPFFSGLRPRRSSRRRRPRSSRRTTTLAGCSRSRRAGSCCRCA